jgi:hypothetical protein
MDNSFSHYLNTNEHIHLSNVKKPQQQQFEQGEDLSHNKSG